MGTLAGAGTRAGTLKSGATLPLDLGHVVRAAPGGPSSAEAQKNLALSDANVCWGACPGGLTEQFLRVTWSATRPGHFTMRFTVPATSWLEADGPHAPLPGDYPVGVQCLAPAIPTVKGPGFKPCGLQVPQASATFHLTGSTPPQAGLGARLQFTPTSAPPGTLVQVQGWAPLNQIDAGQPFGYSLVLEESGAQAGYVPQLGQLQQSPNGDLSGSFRVPVSIPSLGALASGNYTLALEAIHDQPQPTTASTSPGVTITPLSKGPATSTFAERVTLAPTSFQVTAAPSWASLGQVHPASVQWSASIYNRPTVVGDPADLRRLAYCASGEIRVSPDGGSIWTAIPTTGAARAVASTPFQFFQGGSMPVTCTTVVLDPTHPHSYYATFMVVRKGQGPPPENLIGLETTDGGQIWQVVPAPQGYTVDQFGGFQVAGAAVQALFGGPDRGPRPAPFAVDETVDGGRNWKPSNLTCPSTGPCIRFGPAPSMIGGMGVGYPQPIEISSDGGMSWTTPTWPDQVILNEGPSELVALSPTEVALVAAGDQYPLRLSRDGGRNWEVIALPPLPGVEKDGYPTFPGLTLLPDGRLLAASGGNWYALLPGASAWRPVEGASLPQPAGTSADFRAVGDRLWWVESTNKPAASPPAPKSVPLSALKPGPTAR